MTTKAIIYDCEIVKAVPPYQGPLEDGIDYCAGWTDHARMGVSVIGCYDYVQDRYRVFCADNMAEFLALAGQSELIVGFNNCGFDDKVLSADVAGFADIRTPRYDLLREVWVAAGLAPVWERAATHGGYGLDAICRSNFAEGKTGDGANAAIAWQRGKTGTVIDYCLQDIRLTKRLFDVVLHAGRVTDPKSMKALRLRAPTELSDYVEF